MHLMVRRVAFAALSFFFSNALLTEEGTGQHSRNRQLDFPFLKNREVKEF